MKRAAKYTRESPSLAENEKTIESQAVEIDKRISSDGNVLVMEYADNGYAGDILDRPDLDRLRDDASKKIFEILYIFDRDRLARKYYLQELVVEELSELGIEVVFLQERKAETDEDKILQGVRGIFAEYERAKIRERTRRGRLHRANKGLLVGHEAPYGYKYVRPDKDKEEREYQEDEKEAKVVRMIFHWLADDGCSLMEVRRRLYKAGIKARDSGKINWQNSTLSRLVRRTDYIGTMYYNKTIPVVPEHPRKEGYKRMKKTGRKYKDRKDWIPIKIPSIIDPDLFNRAQEQLMKNPFFGKRNVKYPYLLSGLVYCGCSSRMAGGNQGRYRYYRCSDRVSKFPEKSSCTQKIVRVEKLDSLVWDRVSKFLNDPEKIKEQLDQMNDHTLKEKDRLNQQILDIDKEIGKLKKQEEILLKALRTEAITPDQLKSEMSKVIEEENKLIDEKNKIHIQPVPSGTPVTPEMVERYTSLLRKKLPDISFDEKQALLRVVLDQVIVKDKRVIIKGIIPADLVTEIDDYAGQSNFRSHNRIAEHPGNGGGGHFYAFAPILHHSWSSFKVSRRIKRESKSRHQK